MDRNATDGVHCQQPNGCSSLVPIPQIQVVPSFYDAADQGMVERLDHTHPQQNLQDPALHVAMMHLKLTLYCLALSLETFTAAHTEDVRRWMQ